MPAIPAWLSEWVGLPYKKRGRSMDGFDCLGLYLHVHKIRHGVEIPDPASTVFAVARHGIPDGVATQYRQIDQIDVREGDALLFRQKGRPLHLGYCIDRANMLHIEEGGAGSCVERWNGVRWYNRLEGIYRHEHAL